MDNSYFNKVRVIFLFAFNAIVSALFLFLYKTVFNDVIFFIFIINSFVMIFCLKYFCSIDFKGYKLYYRGIFVNYRFEFNDIFSIEKILSNSMLILKLKNGKKLKVCFLEENSLTEFFKELVMKRQDLLVARLENFPIRYYISYIFLFMSLFHITISIFIYYISLSNLLIFISLFLIDVKVLFDDILVIINSVLFYEFREDSIYERKMFFSREYFYNNFEYVSIRNFECSNDNYLCFLYRGETMTKVCIFNKKIFYSMHKVFKYIKKYYNYN